MDPPAADHQAVQPLEVELPGPRQQQPGGRRPARKWCCLSKRRVRLNEHSIAGWEPPAEIVTQLAREVDTSRGMPFVHEVWDTPGVGGKARILCGGLCVTGPPKLDAKLNLCAWLSVLTPVAFLFLVCSSFLWKHGPWLPACTAVLFVLTIALMLATSCTDPGIIPRPAHQLLIPGLQQEVAEAIGLAGQRGGFLRDILSTDEDPELMAVLEPKGYWWCQWCRMIQPPRAKHCRDCNCCVLREDHHCPFLNNCVGQRNYIFFCGFVVALCGLGATFVCGVLLWLFSEEPKQCLAELSVCFRDKPQNGALACSTWFSCSGAGRPGRS